MDIKKLAEVMAYASIVCTAATLISVVVSLAAGEIPLLFIFFSIAAVITGAAGCVIKSSYIARVSLILAIVVTVLLLVSFFFLMRAFAYGFVHG